MREGSNSRGYCEWMCFGTTMAMGQATNRYNRVYIPAWSLYKLSGNMLTMFWHGVERIRLPNRTFVFREATVVVWD